MNEPIPLPKVHPIVLRELIKIQAQVDMGCRNEPVFSTRDYPGSVASGHSDEAIIKYFTSCKRFYLSPKRLRTGANDHLAAMYFEAVRRNKEREGGDHAPL